MAISELGKFMIDHKLHLPPNTRYFGFINPFSCNDYEFGYEAWAMLTNIFESVTTEMPNRNIMIKLPIQPIDNECPRNESIVM